jgi:hypothetical protein
MGPAVEGGTARRGGLAGRSTVSSTVRHIVSYLDRSEDARCTKY